MRKLLLFVALLLPCHGAIAFVNAVAGSHATTNPQTLNVTTGNFLWATIMVSTGGFSCPTGSITDTQSNTWVQVGSTVVHSFNCTYGFRAYNVTGNASLTITFAMSTGSYWTAMSVLQFSGVATSSAQDTTVGTACADGTSCTSGSFTTANASDVIIAGLGAYDTSSGTWSAGNIGGTGSTIPTGATKDDGANVAHVTTEYLIVSSTQSAITAAASNSGSMTQPNIIVGAFKAAGGGAVIVPANRAIIIQE